MKTVSLLFQWLKHNWIEKLTVQKCENHLVQYHSRLLSGFSYLAHNLEDLYYFSNTPLLFLTTHFFFTVFPESKDMSPLQRASAISFAQFKTVL